MGNKAGVGKPLISDEAVLTALKKTGFNQSSAAKELDRSRTWLWDRLNKNEHLMEAFNDDRQLMIDSAESQLQMLIDAGDFNAVKFALSTRGRKRGYGTSIEVTGDSEKPIKIESTMTVEEATTIFRDMLNDDK